MDITMEQSDAMDIRGELASEISSIKTQNQLGALDYGSRKTLLDAKYKPSSPPTIRDRLLTYQASELRRFSILISAESSACRLAILRCPGSSIRWAYSLILEYMLDIAGLPSANSVHDILAAAIQGINHVFRNAAPGESITSRMILSTYTGWVAVCVLQFYESWVGPPRRGSRDHCVRHVLSHRVENGVDTEEVLCAICQYDLFDNTEEKEVESTEDGDYLHITSSNLTEPQSSESNKAVVKTDQPAPSNSARRRILRAWIPDFAHVLLGTSPNQALPFSRNPWLALIRLNRYAPISPTSGCNYYRPYIHSDEAQGPKEILQLMGVKLLEMQLLNNPAPSKPAPSKPVSTGDEVVELACRHLFHSPCVKTWLMENGTCPNCREWLVEWVDVQDDVARVTRRRGEDGLVVKRPIFGGDDNLEFVLW